MADKTAIEWTDATWNPVTGCTKVSPGCDHCYAETFAERWRGTAGHHFEQGFDLTLRPERLTQPLRWTRPRRIFVNSMSDLFHDDVPDGMIAAVWFVMGQCAGLIPEQYRGHVFQILTKRHARMRSWMRKWADVGEPGIPPMDKAALRCGRAELIAQAEEFLGGPVMYDWMDGPRYWPAALPSVWLGVSVENQQWAEIRIPVLLDTPAAVRWLSCEPLLGPVDLSRFLHYRPIGKNLADKPLTPAAAEACRLPALHWVVAGGESGHGARPMHPDWARSLRDQCSAAGVPFLFKQHGAWAPLGPLYEQTDDDPDADEARMEAAALEVHGGVKVVELESDGYIAEGHQPMDRRTWLMARLGKKAAGRELDGRTWDEYPAVSHG